MPIYDIQRIEYAIVNGHIQVIGDGGLKVPAYWAHPQLGKRFSAICLLHDWWGMTNVMRLLANFFAHMGYYVIVPDLYNGQVATTSRDAMRLLEQSEGKRYTLVEAAFDAVQHHHRTLPTTAAVGVGIGGSLVFEAVTRRDDLNAAVAYAGFPHRYLQALGKINTPLLAFYGSDEPHIKPVVIDALRQQLAASPAAKKHRVEVVPQMGHEFFVDKPSPQILQQLKYVVDTTLDFIDDYLIQPPEDDHAREPH